MLEKAVLNYISTVAFIPESKLVIAGGYPRDKILGRQPRDIDVFALEASGKSSDVTEALRWHSIPFMVEPKSYGFPGHSCPELARFDKSIKLRFMEWDVHLVCTPCQTPSDVVETFDFNICRFFYDVELDRIYAWSKTDRSDLHAKNMRLMHDRTPVSSLRRGFLFEYRLGMKFQAGDIRTCVKALHKGGQYAI